MSINKTFHGYIETTKDALLLFEACKRGILPRVNRRLQDKERYLIQSGTIFCFDENESGIKRWTDGLVWSPSRILGNFLVYRELEDKKMMTGSYSTDYIMDEEDYEEEDDLMRGRRSASFSSSSSHDSNLTRKREKAIVGSLKNSYKFKRNGLIKKSISLIVDGIQQHLISYYHKDDVLFQRLNTPSNVPDLSSLQVSPGLKLRQNFRIPFFSNDDNSDDGYNYYGYQSNRSAKRKYSEFIQQQQTSPSSSSTSSSFSSSSSSSFLTAPPDQIKKNYSAPLAPPPPQVVEDEAPMTFKKKDTNTYSNVTRQSGTSSAVVQPTSSSFPPLNMYNNNDMFHTGTSNSNHGTTHHYPILEQRQRQQQREEENPPPTQHHHADNTKRSSSYGTSFRNCYNQDLRIPTLFDQQNPHQHLFSSSSFHTINHAALNQRIDPIANAFMIDIDTLLGTGWNEFELQL